MSVTLDILPGRLLKGLGTPVELLYMYKSDVDP